MKHDQNITLILVLIFLSAQVVGLLITKEYIDKEKLVETGDVSFQSLPYIERPQIQESTSYIWITTALLIGTILILLLIKFGLIKIWKLWFFLSVFACLTVAFAAFMPKLMAVIISFLLTWVKVYKPEVIIHNLTEIFVYGGLAAIFVPIINLSAAFILLIIISLYDMYAVWKSKHMVKMAKFQSKTNVFAGLLIPYNKGKVIRKTSQKKSRQKQHLIKIKVKNAVLGGGDIGFPLMFAGVVMKNLILTNPILTAFLKTLIIPITTSIALYLLLIYGKKNKFYPAMPFLTIGCLIGFAIIKLI